MSASDDAANDAGSLESDALTVAACLREARAAGVERLDALALVAHHWQRTGAWLRAHDDEPMPRDVATRVRRDLARRAEGVPLAYLVGMKEFHGLALGVTPAVLVPRPETEGLVDWALEGLATRAEAAPVVVDLGTGSGAIALAIKHAFPQARVHAVDASTAALDVARANALQLGLDVTWHAGDWWRGGWLGALEGPIALAVSNPPYIAARDPHLDALRHEPGLALASGDDGLDAMRAITAHAAQHLAPGGLLLLEHGWDQGEAVRSLLHGAGLRDVITRRDLAGHERCTGGAAS